MAGAPGLQRLVPPSRLSEDNILKVLLFAQLGIIIFPLRILLGCILWIFTGVLMEFPPARSLILFLASYFTLGIHVNVKGERDEKTRLLISNKVSVFDSLIMQSVGNSLSPSKWDLPLPLAWILGIRYFEDQPTLEHFKDAVRRRFADVANTALFFQPEGCLTSRKGLLKFNEWPFTLYNKVQPVAIEVQRPVGNISSESINYWIGDEVTWSDIFWFMWSPYTKFDVHLLPVIEKASEESCEDFANRTQKVIADFLKIEATNFTSNELKELVASREAERAQLNASVSSRNIHDRIADSLPAMRSDLQTMVAQIKEVLPNVPASVISKDLSKTHNVDVTITNILEGLVHYTPEDESSASAGTAASTSQSSGPPAHLTLCTAAATFSRNAYDRQLSFQERKAQLIETARRRYIEKHGLKIC